jgi:hypothetical protein
MEKKESREAGNCSDEWQAVGWSMCTNSSFLPRVKRLSNNPLCPFCARQKIPQLPIAANGVCRLQFCGIPRTHFAEEEEEEAFGSWTNPLVELKSVELVLSHVELQA